MKVGSPNFERFEFLSTPSLKKLSDYLLKRLFVRQVRFLMIGFGSYI